MSADWEKELARKILSARTPQDINLLIEEADFRYPIKRVPVGRPNNIGTIRMASDPGLALVERLTNGIDALLELGVLDQPGLAPKSPEQAARQVFDVPEGGLGEMSEKARRTLAENLSLSLHESGEKRRPTVVVRDRGLGQHPTDFGTTLLSLNESNKVGKPYTMGTYGQGGSVTFGFSDATIIVSRRHPHHLEGKSDEVGWTIVFEDPGDPETSMLPSYKWLVQDDGSTLSLSPDCFPDLDFGTIVTHVRYDIQSLTGPFQTQLWQFLHATLVDPVLPLLISGDRSDSERKAGSRVVIGNAARLANPDKARGDVDVAAHDEHVVDLGDEYGKIKISYWALTRPSGKTGGEGAASSYVQASNAVSLTLHGQRQDAQPRQWIKSETGLPYLYKNMVVNINANGLRPLGRRELFASTRERATESALRRRIYELVAEILREDPELKRLNREEKEKLLANSTSAANERIRKRLSKFIKTKISGTKAPGAGDSGSGGSGSGGDGTTSGDSKNIGSRRTSGGGKGPARNTDDSDLPNDPTHLAFESKLVRVSRGARGKVWVLLNAKNRYLPKNDEFLSIEWAGEGERKPKVATRSALQGGKCLWSISADEDVDLGTYTMTVTLTTVTGQLSASIPVEVVNPPKPKLPGVGGEDEERGPEVRWVRKDEWDDHDMTVRSVGYVAQDAEATTIWVNRDFDLLAKALASNKLSPDQVVLRADRYQFPVACGLWLQHHEERTNPGNAPTEAYRMAEFHRLAEAVLATIDPDVDLAGVEQVDD